MKLGDIELYLPAAYDEGFPHEYFRMLRREDPVHWQEVPASAAEFRITKSFWVITKHEDVFAISRNPKVFSSWEGLPFIFDMEGDDLAGQRESLIGMDPPEHVKYRRLLQRVFTPRMVREIEPKIRAHAKRIVDELAEKDSCEFVEELASELPLILICELMGIPLEDRKKIFDWSNRLIATDDEEFGAPNDGQAAAIELYTYASTLAEEKKANPDDTLISKMINGEVDGEKITEHHFNSFMVLLSVAGNETTRNGTSHIMRLLSDHPEAYQQLRDNRELLPLAIDECLRMAPPVMQFRRTALIDTEIRGQKIKKGDKLVMFYPSANRDEDVFQDPDTFDITRSPNPHLTFGIGEHFCLGANLAKMQLACIFDELLDRVPDMHVVKKPRLLHSNFIDGIKEMQVEFTRPSGCPVQH
ncbi:MAG: cytochrome P450 [Deltaproteobacteria bacterium]